MKFYRNAYDGCFLPEYTPDSSLDPFDAQSMQNDLLDVCGLDMDCYRTGTSWTIIWMYNAVWVLIMGINFIMLAIGAFWFWPRYVGTVLNCCFGCCHCSAIMWMLSGVLGPAGRICSFNISTSTYQGDYEWD